MNTPNSSRLSSENMRYIGILGSHMVYPVSPETYQEVIGKPGVVNLTPKKLSVLVGAYCVSLENNLTPAIAS